MRRFNEREWTLLYAAWCVRQADLDYFVAIKNAQDAWDECGFENANDPEGIAELDCEA